MSIHFEEILKAKVPLLKERNLVSEQKKHNVLKLLKKIGVEKEDKVKKFYRLQFFLYITIS